jgi:hypothetical protein
MNIELSYLVAQFFGGTVMPKTIAPEIIAERTLELVDRIALHIIPKDDPRSVFGFNLWFKNRYVKVYVRQGRRIDVDTREWVYTLEISSVDVTNENKGYFTTFCKQMERLAAKHGMKVLVENVANEYLQASLQKRGYVLYRALGDNIWPPTYWQA